MTHPTNCPACRANTITESGTRRSAVIWILARVAVEGEDAIVSRLCFGCASLFEGSVRMVEAIKARAAC